MSTKAKSIKFCIALLISFSFSVFASDANLQSKLQGLVKRSGIPADQLGISIRSMKDMSKEVFAVSSQSKMIPASLTKIFTAGAVLSHFDPGQKLTTELYIDGNVSDLTLSGDICIKGDGDPGFVSESLWYLVNEFTRENIIKINGSVRVDNSKFDQNYFDPSRLAKRVDRAYDSPVSGMSFNWNAVNFYLRPGKKVGDPLMVIADPQNAYIELVNKAKTVSGKTDTVQISSLGLSNDGQTEKFLVDGNFGLQKEERVHFRAIADPTIWSGKNLVSFLAQRGIIVNNKVVKGPCSSSARRVAKVESKPLSAMVADMMKFSNNFVAESLSKNLAHNATKKAGSIESAMTHIQNWLVKDFNFESKNFKLVNPSGLTNDNQFRAADISTFLAKYSSISSQSAEFVSSFPIMGRDGTVKSRLKDTKGQDWIRAKTGLLTGVIGLAGYVQYPEQPPLAFAFMYNGSPRTMDKAKQLFDNILLAVPNK